MLFQKHFHPSKKENCICISWGKHWTEMLGLSLAVLQNNVPLQTVRIHETPRVHHTFLFACLQISDVFGVCAAVVSPHVPCLTAMPEDTSQPQAALTSTWYCQRWLYPPPLLELSLPPFTNHTTTLFVFNALHQFCRQTLLSFVNIFSFLFPPSSLGAIFVAIKYKAVVLLEIHHGVMWPHFNPRWILKPLSVVQKTDAATGYV